MRVLNDFEVDVLCAITAVTAQSNSRVTNVYHVPPEAIHAQIVTAFQTRSVGAIKIGMLGTRATVEAVVESLPCGMTVPIVLDPVLVASSGGVLLDAEGRAAMCKRLFPLATIVTPNIPEAAMLLAEEPAIGELALISHAERLLTLGPQAVLLKGGHAGGEEAIDLLISRNHVVRRFASPRIRVTGRGTGCVLASAIAAGLASGIPLADACQQAKRYVVAELSRAEYAAHCW
jgi:hydroxymethylpyrimidine/phosphomethylpyrimidine kinase